MQAPVLAVYSSENANKQGNNQVIYLSSSNFITVNDLYDQCQHLWTWLQGRGRWVVNTDVHVSWRGHDGEAFGTPKQMPSASFIWVGTRPGLHLSHICPRAPATVGWQQSAARAKFCELRWQAREEQRYCSQLLLLWVQYIQAQSIKLPQTVTPKQTEESFSSDT